MKLNARQAAIIGSMTAALVLGFQNCSRLQSADNSQGASSEAAPVNTAAAGVGMVFPGTGSSSVPTADGVVARLTNGLQNNVSPTAGNFAKSLTAVKGNLPRNADPSKASGFDQVQLLVYAACTDLTTGGTASKMKTVYGVTAASTIATNKTALLAAGIKMFDQYTAGLASQGPTSADVTASFNTLLTDVSSVTTNTSTIAFVSVCIAANTAGTTLMGF
ncbi:MAG: hypothetical protein ACXVA9_03740 [Bdellovibrionales bacterium]